MFHLFQYGRALPQGRQLDSLVRDVVARSAADVRRQLRADMSRMGIAELRGYVRARALRPVRRHARAMTAESERFPGVSDVVASRALERTVQVVVRELITAPAIDVPLRAAG